VPVSMSLELAPDLRAWVTTASLEQVILNLMLIRLDAMREPHAGPRTLIIRTARDGAALRVTVRDSGSGIAERYPRLHFTLPEDAEGAR
jgi:C4-dicarboxylate-specific signal transduction histidine kinase